jgi:sigma-E factor negative regulatory protein RseC
MIEDIGRVVKIIDRKAAVEVERTSACAQCGLQEVEELAMGGKVVLEAVNAAQAKVGDRVRVRVESVAYMKAVAAVYGIPVLLFFVGIAIGFPVASWLQWQSEPTSAALGFIGLVMGVLVLLLLRKRATKKEYLPVITEVLGEE